MTTEIKVFGFDGNDVRTTMVDNEPWFVAKDVCNVLNISNTSQALNSLDDDEKGICISDTLGGSQSVSTINESGLYSLILRSRKPEAKKFKKWVTSEVLPTIRKHGMYATEQTLEDMLADPDTMIKTLQTLKKEQEARKLAEAIIIEQAPKVEFANAVSFTEKGVSLTDLSKTLGIKDLGPIKFGKWLRNRKLVFHDNKKKNVPYQKYVEKGWFILDECVVNNRVFTTLKITGKGQQEIVKLLKEDPFIPFN